MNSYYSLSDVDALWEALAIRIAVLHKETSQAVEEDEICGS